MISRQSMVYFARCLSPSGEPIGAIKIGCSFGHDLRIVSVARNLPFTLELITAVPGYMMMEAACHLYLRDHRISGEYFRETEPVTKFVEAAKERGQAFYYITEGNSDVIDERAIEAFLFYHGMTVEDVCKYLKVPAKQYANKLIGSKNRRVIAAACILAQRGQRFVAWPEDALHGLLGKRHPRLPAAQVAA